jgi:hypothetical protein
VKTRSGCLIVLVALFVAAAAPSSAVADACDTPDESYTGNCGPTFTVPVDRGNGLTGALLPAPTYGGSAPAAGAAAASAGWVALSLVPTAMAPMDAAEARTKSRRLISSRFIPYSPPAGDHRPNRARDTPAAPRERAMLALT